jgi:hypothetical protein
MSEIHLENQAKIYAGGCHCGAIRFEGDLDLAKGVSRCNCTWCTKRSTSVVIVKPSAFRLLAGEQALADYAWGGRTGRFFFCSRCGIHAFGRGNLPQLGGEYVSVNVNCLDEFDPTTLKVVYWDGRHDNWAAGPRGTSWPIARAS